MPTVFTHAVVPLALAVAVGRTRVSPRLAIVGAVLAVLPDADVAGFRFGIEYAHEWGHRGATHSIVFAAICAAALSAIWKEARSLVAFAFLTLSMASHGVLDTLTNGGLGAALLWPFDNTRIFAPETPILVSPIGRNFFSERGLDTLMSELWWIWLPCAVIALVGWGVRRAARSWN
ncbi:MAG: metal-dependent hydrolase [Erythrobacter sp.]|uniref:metal-dependent hydrolase n=1 Tax=Erythrobacter sp. TaxID=1042 RepID=UPI003298E91D